MYDNVKRLYDSGRLTAAGVHNAVARGWITAEQAREIVETAEKA